MIEFRTLRVLLAFIVLIAVLVIFIAPFVDLEPTALRAWRAALALLLAIVMLSHVVHKFLPPAVLSGMRTERNRRSSQVRQQDGLFEPNCVLLC